MAQVFLYPATGESPLDEDGNPFPATGLRITMNAYYEGQCQQGLLVRRDPSAFSSVAQPAVYAPFALGYVTTQLSTLPISRDRRELSTVGYVSAGDGGGAAWIGMVGVSSGANGYDLINTTDGQWQLVYDTRVVDARALGAGFGLGSDGARVRRALGMIAATGGVVKLPSLDLTVSASTDTFIVPDNTVIQGVGDETHIVNNGPYTTFNAQSTTGVTIRDLKITHAYLPVQNFQTALDMQFATDWLIDNVTVGMSEAAAATLTPGDFTLHAVAARESERGTVQNSRFRYMQLKMAGAFGGRNMRVLFNSFYRPYDFAVSFVGVATVDQPNPFLEDCDVIGNVVDGIPASGAFYFGGDGESTSVSSMKRIRVESNTVYGSWTTALSPANNSVLVYLGTTSQDIKINNNVFRNDQLLYNSSSGIRVRSVAAGLKVDGLEVMDNRVFGTDHAGIYLDLAGKNIKVARNQSDRGRGIYLIASNGDIVGAEVADNVCKGNGIQAFWLYAQSGNISKLRLRGNTALDIGASSPNNVGFVLEAAATYSISATAVDNLVGIQDFIVPDQTEYGFWQKGAGTVTVNYVDNDASNVVTSFLKRDTGTATGAGNVGTQAPNSHAQARTGTVTISDANTSASVTLTPAEMDGSYVPTLSIGGRSGAALVTTPFPSSIATSGFTVNVPTAPGVGTSVTVRWEIARGAP